MRKTGNLRRIVSGLLAGMTILSTVLSPMTAYAAEMKPDEKPPLYEEVKDLLDEDEVVTAKDYEVEVGSNFDVKSDYTGLEIRDDNKVKVTFEEAKNEKQEDFTTDHVDTYKAVYYVEPVNSEHPKYQISRKLIVRENAVSTQAETEGVNAISDSENAEADQQTEETEDAESDSETEQVTETPAEESQTVGAEEAVENESKQKSLYEMSYEEILEAGAALVEKAMQSGEDETSFTGEDLELYEVYQNVLMAGNSDGVATFADAGSLVVKNAKNETGMWDIPLLAYISSSTTGGPVHNYVKYIANDSANGWRLAYCLQVSKHFIDSTQYIGAEWKQNGMYAEISYAIANGCKKYGQTNNAAYSTGNWIKDYYVTQTVIYCILSDYGYDGHPLSSLSAVSGYQDVYNCVQAMYKDVKKNGNKAGDGYGDNPTYTITAPSSTAMKLNADGTYYQTGWYSVKSSGELVSRSLSLSGAPEGTEIVYKDNSNTSDFYLRIPVAKAYAIGDKTVSFKVKATAKFSRPMVYNYQSKIADAQNVTFLEKKTTNSPKTSEAEASLKLDKAKVSVVKVDSKKGDAKLAGAVFGLYKDQACTQLITEMPATDKKGASTIEIVKTQETVYLKEITAPYGYRINTTAYNVKLVANQTTTATVPDEEQLAELTIYKEGQVLTGADVNENGTTFHYENRRQKNAVYNVYAGADIVTAYGTKVYSKGDLVKENLTTGENGSVTLKNLHLGVYVVKEATAPENFYNGGEEKTVTLTYAGQNKEVVFADVTFNNERQKAEVTVVKQDKDTKKPLGGGIFALYAANDIANADGTVVVKKGTLIEKVTTGADGTAKFTADLPIGYSYSVKEDQHRKAM